MNTADRREAEELRAKPGTLTPEEFRRLAVLEGYEAIDEILGDFEEHKSVVGVAAKLIGITTGHRAGQYAKRYALEQRIAAIETALPKPRQRVKALSRPQA